MIGKIKVLLLCHFVIELSTEPLLPPLKQETREKKIIVKFLTVLLANDKVMKHNREAQIKIIETDIFLLAAKIFVKRSH